MMARRGAAVILWGLLLGALLTTITDAFGLKHVQGVIWPTDLYTFEHMDAGPIDVAIFGSSRASFALSPSAMDACLTEALGRQTSTVNLSRTFSTAWTANAVVSDLLVGDRVPKVLLLGVGPEFFNEYNHQRSLSFASHGDIADVPGALLRTRSVTELFAALRPFSRGAESLALFLSGRHEAEEQLRWMMLHHGGGQFCYGSPSCTLNNTNIKEALRPRWATATNTLPRLKEERFSRYVVGEGLVHDSMRSLIDWSREHDVVLGIVQLPLHQTFVRQIPEWVITQSNDYLLRLSQYDQIPMHRGTEARWSQKRASYIDPDHIGPTASRQFTESVCRSMVLPRLKGTD